MYLKDITKNQSIEICKLLFPFEFVVSGFVFKYQEYDWQMYEDAAELISIKFLGTLTDKSDPVQITAYIYPNLDCYIYYVKNNGIISKELPNGNQYYIQKKFREWGIYPDNIEMRDGEIEK